MAKSNQLTCLYRGF